MLIDLRQLIATGIQYGHTKARSHYKMAPYIWGVKNNIQLINVGITAVQLERAAAFLKDIAAKGQTILWVGTKKAAAEVIAEIGKTLKQPHVSHRWIGGTLSNYSQVKKSVTKCLTYQEILDKTEQPSFYTKKEFNTIQKAVERLEKNIGGIKQLRWPVGAIVIIDVRKEQSALKEAARMGIPVVALVDTNNDPSLVDYVIPGNDDSARSIRYVLDYLSDAAQQGQEIAQANQQEQAQEQRMEKEALLKERKAKKIKPQQASDKTESESVQETVSEQVQ